MKLKSKDQFYLFDDNFEFIQELKQVGVEEAKGFLVQDNYRKAIYYYKLVVKIDPEDPATKMIKGVVDLYNKNTKEGMIDINYALEKYESYKEKGYEPDDEVLMAFQDGFIYYADFLVGRNQQAKAQEILELARTLAPENEKFKKKLEEVTS